MFVESCVLHHIIPKASRLFHQCCRLILSLFEHVYPFCCWNRKQIPSACTRMSPSVVMVAKGRFSELFSLLTLKHCLEGHKSLLIILGCTTWTAVHSSGWWTAINSVHYCNKGSHIIPAIKSCTCFLCVQVLTLWTRWFINRWMLHNHIKAGLQLRFFCADKIHIVPKHVTFCLTSVSNLHRGQARYTFSAETWLEEAGFGTVELHKHKIGMKRQHWWNLVCLCRQQHIKSTG